MSILIKGMKMPRNCTECQFLKWERRFEDGDLGHCCKVGRTTYYDKSECPLVEVPPHGRLTKGKLLAKLNELGLHAPEECLAGISLVTAEVYKMEADNETGGA